jgi:ribosome-associated heat shock protein Hsp15
VTVLRLDKLLWHLRVTKSRTLAQKIIAEGLVRIDRQRIVTPSAGVRPGQTLTLMMHDQLRVIRVDRIPERRGPAEEAQSCYTEILQPQAIDAPLHCD